MADENLRLIHSQLRTAQDKYTYFLLAISASAIAFSLQITSTSLFTLSLAPLGLAILAWAGSFFSGCRHVQFVNSTIFANTEYLKIQSGNHPEVGTHPDYINAAMEGIKEAVSKNSNKANAYGQSQFRLLILGGILFIAWHIIEMIIRTNG